MADVIQLLPDAIANQIAAGEVIQRPASVVKELLENSIDAGSSTVKLIIKDAGKTLIQVIDDGCGMSPTDARMSFERHATSKLRNAKDLFLIHTKGFRGEALASIAAIAHVELKTRRKQDELGNRIIIEGSKVKTQEPCQGPVGTNFMVKNLFFNVPARRNFLKSDSVEMRHINEEFVRVAMAHPDIFFSLHHNGNETHHLPATNLRQRLVGIFGPQSNKKLVPIEEKTEVVSVSGFISKPSFAKRSRGEQYFFVNNRFIKSGYLHHALMSVYEDLIAKDTYPLYAVFLHLDPSRIDVNVHPTKQEIKFEDERLVYNFLKVAAKHALGQHSVTPTLDFDQNVNFGTTMFGEKMAKRESSSSRNQHSPFRTSDHDSKRRANNLKQWEALYEGLEKGTKPVQSEPATLTIESKATADQHQKSDFKETKAPYQLHNRYIVSPIKSGFVLIDQQAAHERILFERELKKIREGKSMVQTQLFPKPLELSPQQHLSMEQLVPRLNEIGFDLRLENEEYILYGAPASLREGTNEQDLIERLLDHYLGEVDLKLDWQEKICRAFARASAIRPGTALSEVEMRVLIDQLFACEVPFQSPMGRYCFISYDLADLEKRFELG